MPYVQRENIILAPDCGNEIPAARGRVRQDEGAWSKPPDASRQVRMTFRVEHVGSFLRPERLLDAARATRPAGSTRTD
jgi:hypothetical protein